MKVGLSAPFKRGAPMGRWATAPRPGAAFLATCLLLTALPACGSENAEPSDAGDSCTGEGDNYRVGLSKTSAAGSFTVELSDANPAPPAIGTNAWMLRIEDASGNG